MYNLISKRKSILTFGLAFLLITTSFAQFDLDPENDIPLSAEVVESAVPSDGSGILNVTIDMPDLTHITSRDFGFFFIEPDSSEGINWGIPSFPTPTQHDGEDVYQGVVELTIPFSIGSLKKGSELTVEGTVGYQICTESEPIYCTPPVERRFSAGFTVAAKGTASASNSDSAQELTIEQRAIQALERGSIFALLWIFVGGMLLSLTPCVYPMIPITIAYIGARSQGQKLKGLSLSLVFVLGLGLMYSSLGVIAAATGGVFGLSGQNPYVIGFVTIVFLVMGIGMLGAFEIALPSSIQTRLTGGKRKGYFGALLVGATTGLVAAPCVGPVLIALLGWVSSTGNLFLGFLYLFVFACGLGVLFIVIGTFAGAMSALPTAGVWMETIKKGFGIIMIAMAIYFGKSMIPADWHLLIVGLAYLLLAGMLGGFSRAESSSGMGQMIGRGFARFIVLIGMFYVLLALARLEGINLTAMTGDPMAVKSPAQTHKSDVNWIYNDEVAAFEQAKSSGKLLIIDFWAEWCAACKELDHKTFSDPRVHEKMNNSFVALKIDGTKVTDEVKAVWAKYGVKGLPTVLVMSSDREELARFEAFRTVDEVIPLLNEFADN